MIKKYITFIEYFHKIFDLLIVVICWMGSYYLRFETGIPDTDKNVELFYIQYGFLLLLLSYYFFRKYNFYNSKRFDPYYIELFNILKANVFISMVFVFLIYFLSSYKLSRSVILFYFISSTLILQLYKIHLRFFLYKFRLQGKNLKHIVFIGDGEELKKFYYKFYKKQYYGIKILYWFGSKSKPAQEDGIKYINCLDKKYITSGKVDMVIIGFKNNNFLKTNYIIRELSSEALETIVVPEVNNSLLGYSTSIMAGVPVIKMNEPKIVYTEMILKRLFDLMVSFFILFFLSPLFFLIGILIKLTSKGPIFYSQERMSIYGKSFKMYKFRTMDTGKNNDTGWTIKNDPRVTIIGKFLRSTSIDELPQFYNVLLGDMSIVGPRPERPLYVEKFKKNIPNYMLRHKVKSGITGWAQINGWRGDTSIEKRLECDIFYISNWSIWMDILIVLMTPWKGLINKNAY